MGQNERKLSPRTAPRENDRLIPGREHHDCAAHARNGLPEYLRPRLCVVVDAGGPVLAHVLVDRLSARALDQIMSCKLRRQRLRQIACGVSLTNPSNQKNVFSTSSGGSVATKACIASSVPSTLYVCACDRK